MLGRLLEREPEIDLSGVPEELYGKWIAVTKRDSSVIADGDSMREVTDKALKTTEDFFVTVVRPCTGGFLL